MDPSSLRSRSIYDQALFAASDVVLGELAEHTRAVDEQATPRSFDNESPACSIEVRAESRAATCAPVSTPVVGIPGVGGPALASCVRIVFCRSLAMD